MQIKRFNFEKFKMVKEHLTFVRRIRGFYMLFEIWIKWKPRNRCYFVLFMSNINHSCMNPLVNGLKFKKRRKSAPRGSELQAWLSELTTRSWPWQLAKWAHNEDGQRASETKNSRRGWAKDGIAKRAKAVLGSSLLMWHKPTCEVGWAL